MSRLRFIHTADLHLDSPFIGIKAVAPDNVADALQDATFGAYENIISLCIDERVHALLVAGDVYDSADQEPARATQVRRGPETAGRCRHTLFRLPRQSRSARRLGGAAGLSARLYAL